MKQYTSERAFYRASDTAVAQAEISVGESPFKEGKNLSCTELKIFSRYPFWYCRDVAVTDSEFLPSARAGMWYTDNLSLHHCVLSSPKNFRKCRNLVLNDISLSDGAETLWQCDGVVGNDIFVSGDYFAKDSKSLTLTGLHLEGKYSFDGCENVTLSDSVLHTKDAFWNCRNVVVKDSLITGEYIGWNAENLTFENCFIASHQGFCYCKNLTLVRCDLTGTDYAFEFSDVQARDCRDVNSIFNPKSGSLEFEHIGCAYLEPDKIKEKDTVILCRAPYEIKKQVEWEESDVSL